MQVSQVGVEDVRMDSYWDNHDNVSLLYYGLLYAPIFTRITPGWAVPQDISSNGCLPLMLDLIRRLGYQEEQTGASILKEAVSPRECVSYLVRIYSAAALMEPLFV